MNHSHRVESTGRSMPSGEPIKIPRTIVLIGLMGAGKTCMGRLLAAHLNLPFVDADSEIELAAGCSIEEIFAQHGEAAFRDGERRVIARLLQQPTQILSTGGGAFMDPDTQAAIREHALSVWLRADTNLLLKRTARRNNRPLLKTGDPRQILEQLAKKRDPEYSKADIIVDSADGPPEVTFERLLTALTEYLQANTKEPAGHTAPGDGTQKRVNKRE